MSEITAADRRLLDDVPSWRKFPTLSGYCYPEDTVLALIAAARSTSRTETLEDAAKICRAAQYSPHPYTDIKHAIHALRNSTGPTTNTNLGEQG